jgi:molybdopterin-guanine dinucleotide biosynthesis protein B
MVPVIAFVGRHNSGKTTILAKVINILQLRGIKSGVIKHSHHSPTPDNHDSGKLFAAGAEQVFLSTPYVSLLYRREEEKRLDTIIEQINLQVDIIFLEGYKKSQHPKIEIIRQEVDAHPLGGQQCYSPCYRVYVCQQCHGYLKTYDERTSGQPVDMYIANISTIYLDMLAQEQGYTNHDENQVT